MNSISLAVRSMSTVHTHVVISRGPMLPHGEVVGRRQCSLHGGASDFLTMRACYWKPQGSFAMVLK